MPITLTAATVKVRTTDVVLKWQTSELVPHEGTVTFSTTFLTPSGAFGRQLGFKLVDSRWVASFTFDHRQVRNEYVQAKPQRVGSWWQIGFPLDALGDVTPGDWQADLAIDTFNAPTVTGTVPAAG